MTRTSRCETCRNSPSPCAPCHDRAEERARAEWEAYCRSGEKRVHVPDRPDVVYQDAWRGWQEWLTWVGIPAPDQVLAADEVLWAKATAGEPLEVSRERE